MNALKEIDLEVREGDFCVLLGPSGCGKTTTLRCVAGLERPDGGEIEIAGRRVNSAASKIYVPAEKREIGMVFQSYAIWPHMSVFENVSFPLTQGQKRIPRSAVADRVRTALKRVQLDGLEDRPATDLSGGQQQRVAMARAMVTDAKVLLMDEPLSNLDARLREQMRVELRKITKSIGVTTLYVTHDQAEALSLGDKVCVMHLGEILQVARPDPKLRELRDLDRMTQTLAVSIMDETKLPSLPPATRLASRTIPPDAFTMYSRALLYEDKGDKAKAIEYYQKALDVFPDFTEAKEGLRKARGSGT